MSGSIRPRAAAVLVLIGVFLSGVACGCSAPHKHEITGPVTTQAADRLCIGGPKASGVCLLRGATDLTRYPVGSCVHVVWSGPGKSGADGTAVTIKATSSATYCP